MVLARRLMARSSLDALPSFHVGSFVPVFSCGETMQYPVANSGAKFAASMTRMFYHTGFVGRIRGLMDLSMAAMNPKIKG